MRKAFVIAGAGAAVLLFGAMIMGMVTVSQWNQPLTSFDIRTFEVRRGETVQVIGNRLALEGFIERSWVFEALVRVSGLAGALQAGLYEIPPGTSLRDFVSMVSQGKSVPNDVTVRIVEGLTVPEAGRAFEQAGLFSAAEFEAASRMGDDLRDIPIIKPLENGTSLIGYLFPDTYRFRPNDDARRAVRRMVENAARRFSEAGIDDPFDSFGEMKNLFEVLTFASIVQKEAPAGDEDLIAGVFANRLENGWRFESDATVNFILNTSKLIPSARDIQTDHPYNTYLNRGLPPGPINSPGLEAIRASIEPAVHDYFFFLHTPDRVTILSRTFEEHLENRAKYWE